MLATSLKKLNVGAREMMTILGYAQWNNFYTVISKAKEVCENAGGKVADNFANIGKMVGIGSITQIRLQND